MNEKLPKLLVRPLSLDNDALADSLTDLLHPNDLPIFRPLILVANRVMSNFFRSGPQLCEQLRSIIKQFFQGLILDWNSTKAMERM